MVSPPPTIHPPPQLTPQSSPAPSINPLLIPPIVNPTSPLTLLHQFALSSTSSLIIHHHFLANPSLTSHPLASQGMLPQTRTSPEAGSAHISWPLMREEARSRLSRRLGKGRRSMYGRWRWVSSVSRSVSYFSLFLGGSFLAME